MNESIYQSMYLMYNINNLQIDIVAKVIEEFDNKRKVDRIEDPFF